MRKEKHTRIVEANTHTPMYEYIRISVWLATTQKLSDPFGKSFLRKGLIQSLLESMGFIPLNSVGFGSGAKSQRRWKEIQLKRSKTTRNQVPEQKLLVSVVGERKGE